jgi:DNA-binding transcriptional regulator YiaG
MRRARRKRRKQAGGRARGSPKAANRRPARRRSRRTSGGGGSPALDVAAIRAKTGLSQERFAVAFRISPHTLRNWEQGRRRPEGPARALILAIDRDPLALMRALEA